MRLFVDIIPNTPYEVQVIDFALSNNSIIAKKLPSTYLERFLKKKKPHRENKYFVTFVGTKNFKNRSFKQIFL